MYYFFVSHFTNEDCDIAAVSAAVDERFRDQRHATQAKMYVYCVVNTK